MSFLTEFSVVISVVLCTSAAGIVIKPGRVSGSGVLISGPVILIHESTVQFITESAHGNVCTRSCRGTACLSLPWHRQVTHFQVHFDAVLELGGYLAAQVDGSQLGHVDWIFVCDCCICVSNYFYS